MRVAVFGLGYVGCTAVACIASQGHHVVGFDPNAAKVHAIANGLSPIREPGIDDLLAEAHRAGLLDARVEVDEALDGCDLALVCVGTPSGANGAHNMSFIVQVTRQIAAQVARRRSGRLTVAYRSTMRPGSIDQIIEPIFRSIVGENYDAAVEIVYNPEFLREASSIEDYFNPPKIVIGTRDGTPSAVMAELNRGIEAKTFHVRFREAEITKFVDNSWHAVKVAFANEVGRICEMQGISAKAVHEVFVSDTKLNLSAYYLRPGGPFGGSCLPKDVRAVQYIAADVGANAHLLDSLMRSNDAHKHYQFTRVAARLKPGARVLIAGLAFKSNTDDLRESPAVDLARKLIDAGHTVEIFDPCLKPESLIGQNLGYAYSLLPTIDKILVDRDTAQAGGYDLVVATNATVKALDLAGAEVIDVSAMA